VSTQNTLDMDDVVRVKPQPILIQTADFEKLMKSFSLRSNRK
jgi:hypothetical protein